MIPLSITVFCSSHMTIQKKNDRLRLPSYILGGLMALGLAACGGSGQKGGPNVRDTVVQATETDPVLNIYQTDTLKGSPLRKLNAKLGTNDYIDMSYHSPGVRGRIIWGGLVPYGQVWVTGAHMATVIHFSGDTEVAGNPLPAGVYTLFSIPGPEEWTIILNRNWDQHLTDEYDAKEDVFRFKVKPEVLPDTVQRFTYFLTPKADPKALEMAFAWEKFRVAFEVKLK
jgi:Protein of unknown function (DUF2911)